jgi:flagellar motor switch protein FliM
MLGLVEFDSAKIQGLLNIDTSFAYHLIDLMLGGDPAVAPVPVTRTFTEIDMALCRIAQEAVLAAFAEALATCFGRPLARPLHLAGQRQDVTQIRFAAEHTDVLVYNIALDIGPAARSGGVQLVLPLAMLDTICAVLKDKAVKAPSEQPWDLWKVSMRHAASRSPVVVDAVLHRRKMTISELSALRVGDVLEMPGSAVTEVQLIVAQPGGKRARVAGGRLGTYLGAKVVKLDASVDPRLRDHVRQLCLGPSRPSPGSAGGR